MNPKHLFGFVALSSLSLFRGPLHPAANAENTQTATDAASEAQTNNKPQNGIDDKNLGSAAGPKIEVEGAGAEQHTHKVVIFHGADGKEIKRISLEGGMVTKNGKKERRSVHAIASADGNRVVTVEEERDANEHNPYVTRFASAALVSLYDAGGERLCSIQTRAVPRTISKTGRAFAAIDQGIDPESFEVLHDVPGLQSIADLKGDASLTDSYLHVLNDSCQVIFSTVGAKGGWNVVLVSPSGRWLAYEQFESQVVTDNVTEYHMQVVEVPSGRTWTLVIDSHRDIEPRRINNDGSVIGRKYVGESQAISREVLGTDGKQHKLHKSRVQYFAWKPGMTIFQPNGPEVEEDR